MVSSTRRSFFGLNSHPADLNVIEGRREQLEGKLQQRYGFAKDQIHKDVDDWFKTLR